MGCKSENLREEDLEQGFIDAWNEIVENRESYMGIWEKMILTGNAWERLKAKQTGELTMEGNINKAYPELVNLVLDCIMVGKDGRLITSYQQL